MRGVFTIIAMTALTGCAYNRAPIHLYMLDHEMTRAVNASFCQGQPAEAIAESLDTMEIGYRSFIDPETRRTTEIEAQIRKAGPRISIADCCPGIMVFAFDEGLLAAITFRHPLADDPTLLASARHIRLEPCETEDPAAAAGDDAP